MSDNKKYPELEAVYKKIHVDSSHMSLNIHDQLFVKRVLDMHYGSFFDEVKKHLNDLYELQTKDLAEVIVTYHNDHLREMRQITDNMELISDKLRKVESNVARHARDIRCIKRVLRELHGKEI